jgi:hypothetical protein
LKVEILSPLTVCLHQLDEYIQRDLNNPSPTVFLAVDKAYKNLLDPEQKKRAVDVIQAGREYVEHNVSN